MAFPLGSFIAVTGVSGSGKSSLVNEVLYHTLARRLHRARTPVAAIDDVVGIEQIDKVINVDQAPIGNSPLSNPATYTGVFDLIRQLFAQLPEAKVRGYQPRRFSFTKPGGRCEACEGNGQKVIEMHFLPDVWVECDVCNGKRYNPETLAVRYKNHSIADVLTMTVHEALEVFGNIPKIRRVLQTLADVGLDYLALGQAAPTLSGGEAQRVKLASELARPSTGRTLYILDEPTTGLHFDDVHKLLDVLNRLVDLGNTAIVVEHNLDVIKTADWIIDLGPEAGPNGGQIVVAGTPEEVCQIAPGLPGKAVPRQAAQIAPGLLSRPRQAGGYMTVTPPSPSPPSSLPARVWIDRVMIRRPPTPRRPTMCCSKLSAVMRPCRGSPTAAVGTRSSASPPTARPAAGKGPFSTGSTSASTRSAPSATPIGASAPSSKSPARRKLMAGSCTR